MQLVFAQAFWSDWPWQVFVGVAAIAPVYLLARVLGGQRLIERLVYSTNRSPAVLADALVEYAVLVQVAGGHSSNVAIPDALKRDPAFRQASRLIAAGAAPDEVRAILDHHMNQFSSRAARRRRLAIIAALAPIALLVVFMLAAAHLLATPTSTNAWSAAATLVALLSGFAGVTLGVPLLERLPRAESARLMELMLIEAASHAIAQALPPATIRDRLRAMLPAAPTQARARRAA